MSKWQVPLLPLPKHRMNSDWDPQVSVTNSGNSQAKRTHLCAHRQQTTPKHPNGVYCFVLPTVLRYTNAKLSIVPLSPATISLLSQWQNASSFSIPPIHKIKTLLSHRFPPLLTTFPPP